MQKENKFRDFATLKHKYPHIISEFQAKQKVTVNFLHYPGVILHENNKYWSVMEGEQTRNIEAASYLRVPVSVFAAHAQQDEVLSEDRCWMDVRNTEAKWGEPSLIHWNGVRTFVDCACPEHPDAEGTRCAPYLHQLLLNTKMSSFVDSVHL